MAPVQAGVDLMGEDRSILDRPLRELERFIQGLNDALSS